ncbi:uncharacterized protein LOC112453489 [Temnothorax curvispinosus]|uniref:Uncharacterized protein LOC112453489 n=1 Tax=Temnothorax curvispinosus TaxID=300111 RepID=A0A6J1PL19_9HYME|nr:uncharacterized protein LOC112453489 [Temnothorax curvispinosus]
MGNYYGQFNNREEEIVVDRRGLALAAACGTSWSQVVQRGTERDNECREHGTVEEMIESIMLLMLMKRFPLARDGLRYDVVCVKTNNLSCNVNIVAMYRHPCEPMARNNFGPVFNAVGGNGLDTIILGDFNVHSGTWNCPTTDVEGDLFYEIMDSEGLICVNVDTCSRGGVRGQRDTNIDLLFGMTNIVGDVSYFRISDAWGSDHHPISFSFDNSPLIYGKTTNCLSTKKTDWSRFRKIVDSEMRESIPLRRSFLERDLETCYSSFIEVIKSAVADASGRRSTTPPTRVPSIKKKPSHKWWDAECDKVIRNRKETLKAFKNTKSLHDWFGYKKTTGWARQTIKRKKKAGFEEFCRGIDRFTSLSYVWKIMRIFKNARKNLEWNAWPTKNREEVVKSTIESLSPALRWCRACV